jgi:hypothetical protein
MKDPLGDAVMGERKDVVKLFERRVRDLWSRDGLRIRDLEGIACALSMWLAEEGPASPTGSEVLKRTGVRSEWNRVLARQRSEALAGWIGPYLEPPVLDVLGGDFMVLLALVNNGLDASACIGCERRSAYETDWDDLAFPVYDVPEPLELPSRYYRTALVSTVLHHEPDVQRLLEALAAGPAERWVVIENACDADNSEPFHLFVDEFFNRCLNTFDVPCVPQHRTVAQWCEILGNYGQASFAGVMEDVPGIPFPYQMFIVDRTGRDGHGRTEKQ